MLANIPILSMITFSPLIGIILLLLIPKDQGRWIKIIGIAATFVPLLLAIALYAGFNQHSGQMQFVEDATWMNIPLNKEGAAISGLSSFFILIKYKMGVDGLSLALVFLTALVSSMAALAATHIKKRWKSFYIWFLLLEVGMFGVFMARDLLLFFAYFELTLIPTFFLVAIWGFKEREKAGTKFLIYNGIGSAVMVIAFLVLMNTAGFTLQQTSDNVANAYYTSDIDQIMTNLNDPSSYANYQKDITPGVPNPLALGNVLKWSLFIMILIGFGIKLPMFPFHSWMTKVHAEAHPSIVMIHSGIHLKMGAYGLIRFGVLLFPEQAKSWAVVLAILGTINILYGAVLAYRQTDFKLVLAYSSISHMGIIMLGIAAFNIIGLEGAIFQMVSHGLISALMFLMVGSFYERTGTTTLSELGGLAKSVPFMSGILLFGGLASLGLPGLSGFISEFLAFLGLFETMPIVTAIAMLGIILAAVYSLRGVMKITYGPMHVRFSDIKDARLIEAIPMAVFVAFILLVGVYPSVLSEPLKHTVELMMQNISIGIGG